MATLGILFAATGPIGWTAAGVVGALTVGVTYGAYKYHKHKCDNIIDNMIKQTNNHPFVMAHEKELRQYMN